jgi:PEGA domain-containing protein
MTSVGRILCRGAIIVSALLSSAQAVLANLPMERHMQIQMKIQNDPDLAKLPSIRIDTILANVTVDDRLNADTAFDKPFVDALKQGMTWYLTQRGMRVVTSGEDLRLAGTIESYEGFKGWGHWGVDVTLGFKIIKGDERLPSLSLRSFLKYSSDDEVRVQEAPKYEEQKLFVSFQEVLFTRIGADLCEKLIDSLKEGETKAAPTAPGPAGTSARGSISIDANVPNAEVRVDDQLIGTVPLANLPLPEGHHLIEVSKKGYGAWKKDVLILAGAASHLVAELDSEKK